MSAGRGQSWSRRFAVRPGTPVRLSAWDPAATPGIEDKKEGRRLLGEITDRLRCLQRVLYAGTDHAVLVVLQAMDTGGKDGTIRHVFGPLNPQGVKVHNFKVPSALELAHDYLWRIHAAVPARGMIGVFNRSHYEDVLVTRVHRLVPPKEINRRYRQINDFERHLAENRVTVRKFFLHISKHEQKRRLEARLESPEKHWKFSTADLAERKLWSRYIRAYEKALGNCATAEAPWFVIPADHKWYRNVAVAQILCETLESLALQYPAGDPGLDSVTVV